MLVSEWCSHSSSYIPRTLNPITSALESNQPPITLISCDLATPSQNLLNPSTFARSGSYTFTLSVRLFPHLLSLPPALPTMSSSNAFLTVNLLTKLLTVHTLLCSSLSSCLSTCAAFASNHLLNPSFSFSRSTCLFTLNIRGATPPPQITSFVPATLMQHSGGRILVLTRSLADGRREIFRLSFIETSWRESVRARTWFGVRIMVLIGGEREACEGREGRECARRSEASARR